MKRTIFTLSIFALLVVMDPPGHKIKRSSNLTLFNFIATKEEHQSVTLTNFSEKIFNLKSPECNMISLNLYLIFNALFVLAELLQIPPCISYYILQNLINTILKV